MPLCGGLSSNRPANYLAFDEELVCLRPTTTGKFPQLATANMTANSSPWIFGAYRELGRYYARQLAWFWGVDAQKKTIDQATRDHRYQDVLGQQLLSPLVPIRTSSMKATPCYPAALTHQGHCVPIRIYNSETSVYRSQQQPSMN